MASKIDDMGDGYGKVLHVSRAALGVLFSSTASVIVGNDLVRIVQKVLPDSVTLIKLTSDRILCLPDETDFKEDALSSLSGIPIGLKAIVCKDAEEPTLRHLMQAIEKTKPFTLPHVFEVRNKRKATVMAGLLEVFAKANDAELDRFGAVTEELATLRQEYEKALNQLEKFKRLKEVLGYSHASLTYETPVSAEGALGAGVQSIRQHLPVDLTGLKAIELYATDIDHACSTQISLSVVRIGDNTNVWETKRNSDNFTEGWNLFEIEPNDPSLYGEVELFIEWEGGDLGLRFAYSDVEASRFGLHSEQVDEGSHNQKTLALKVFQGPTMAPISKPTTLSTVDPAPASNNDNETCRPLDEVSLHISKFSELVSRVGFVHGREEHVTQFNQHGFWPLMLNEDQSYMQTHPLIDKTCAAILHQGAASDMVRLGVEVRTAHEAAAPFRYILMRLPDQIDNKSAAVETIVTSIDDGATDGVTYLDDATGIVWSSKVLPAETVGMVEIALDAPIGKSGDLAFAVVAATDSTAYGWCRWYSLYTETISSAK